MRCWNSDALLKECCGDVKKAYDFGGGKVSLVVVLGFELWKGGMIKYST